MFKSDFIEGNSRIDPQFLINIFKLIKEISINFIHLKNIETISKLFLEAKLATLIREILFLFHSNREDS